MSGELGSQSLHNRNKIKEGLTPRASRPAAHRDDDDGNSGGARKSPEGVLERSGGNLASEIGRVRELVEQSTPALLSEIQQLREELRRSKVGVDALQGHLSACVREETRQAARESRGLWEKQVSEILESARATRSIAEGTSQQLRAVQDSLEGGRPTAEDAAAQYSVLELQNPILELPARVDAQPDAEDPEEACGLPSTMPVRTATVVLGSTDLQAFQEAHGWSKKDEPVAAILRNKVLLSRLDKISMLLIVLNLVFMGVEVSLTMDALRANTSRHGWLGYIYIFFAIAFIIEIGLKIGLEGKRFFCGPDKEWNIFDFILSVSPLLDIVSSFVNLSFMRSLKTFRLVRAARMIKGYRSVRVLRLMVASIISSATSLLWALVMMVLLLYVYSLFIMSSITRFAEEGAGRLHADALAFYGTLYDSMKSLFMGISGGIGWGDLVAPLAEISEVYVVCFAVYIVFVVFGVMNILTAIFVESSMSISDIDRDLVIQENISRETSCVNELKSIFLAADSGSAGRLTREMLEERMQNSDTVQCLKLIGLDINETRGLFQLLDIGNKNYVEIEEFVCGMMRLKGTGMDIATMMYESKRILSRLEALQEFLEHHMPRVGNCRVVQTPGHARGKPAFARKHSS